MKIRTGFVSNSSSSSFCILGVLIQREEFNEIRERIFDYGLLYECGISNYKDTDAIIGFCPWHMKEDETFAQFKDRVKEALNKVLKKKVSVGDISYYVDGGYNG